MYHGYGGKVCSVAHFCFVGNRWVISAVSTIVRIYTTEGFVIAPDGRSWYSDDSEPSEENCQKIFCFPAGPHLSFSFVGTFELGSAFDFADVVGSTLNDLLPASGKLSEFAFKLSYVIYVILNTLRRKGRVRFTEAPTEVLMHSKTGKPTFTIAYVLIDGYFRGIASRAEIRFSHDAQNLADPEPFPIQLGDECRVHGSRVVMDLFDYDPRFEKYRIGGMPLHESEKLSQAANRAKGIVEAQGSPEGRALDEEICSTIGGRTQIATITPTAGFRWVPGFEPVSPA